MTVTTALLELARERRGDDWAAELALSFVAAHNAGWSQDQVLVTTARLLVDPKSRGRDLGAEARKATVKVPGSPPSAEYHAIREAVEESC